MTNALTKKVRGIHFLLLAFYAFLGLGIEAFYGYLIEPLIYGSQINDWNTPQYIIHWSVTCITWGIITFLILKASKVYYGFDLLASSEKMKPWQWICIALFILFSLGLSYWDWGGFKVIIEFQKKGLVKFIVQYIYYIFETCLFTLIIVYGQKAFELWFKNNKIPYGGIILAATWGVAHIFTKGSLTVGLLSALAGFLYGSVYLIANRDIKKTLPVLFIMFML